MSESVRKRGQCSSNPRTIYDQVPATKSWNPLCTRVDSVLYLTRTRGRNAHRPWSDGCCSLWQLSEDDLWHDCQLLGAGTFPLFLDHPVHWPWGLRGACASSSQESVPIPRSGRPLCLDGSLVRLRLSSRAAKTIVKTNCGGSSKS